MGENTRDNDQLRKLEADKGEDKDAGTEQVQDPTPEPTQKPNDAEPKVGANP